ncbi:MAG: hypothetical protein ACRENC_18975, partial [Gemmatimonadaceae bacterium]
MDAHFRQQDLEDDVRDAGRNLPARFPNREYSIPGHRTNYREVVIHQQVPPYRTADEITKAHGFTGWGDPAMTDLDRAKVLHERDRQIPPAGRYKSSHWPDIENPVVHVRLDDRTLPNGERALVANEIQSDWHQAGRKHGYQGDAEPPIVAEAREHLAGLERRRVVVQDQRRALRPAAAAALAKVHYFGLPNEHEAFLALSDAGPEWLDQIKHGTLSQAEVQSVQEYRHAHDSLHAIARAMDETERQAKVIDRRVPNGPFTNTEEWAELGLKRVIDEAVHGPYDRVVLPTGKQAADYFNLSKQVDEVRYDPATEQLVARKRGADIHKGTYDARALEGV